MITSEAGFLIATPTKCGTTTMEAIARRHMRTAGVDADLFRIMDWDSPRRQHRMALPPSVAPEGSSVPDPEWGEVQRYLFVRNPYTRYMSIYTYLSAPANYSQWGAREVQGNLWGGHDASKRLKRSSYSFEQFLFWLADKRETASRMKRADLTHGGAYRSPWVWTDPLDFSLEVLRGQPGGAQEWPVEFLRLESIWEDLAALSSSWELGLDLSPIHANRSTGWGSGGADPGSGEFWGGIRCARGGFKERVFCGSWIEDHQRSGNSCSCAACAVGVYQEAVATGYVTAGA